MIRIRQFTPADQSQVLSIWYRCGLVGRGEDPIQDIDRQMEMQPALFLVGAIKQTVIGTIMGGYEGPKGWISHLAVAPEWQRLGYGRVLLQEMETVLRELGCPRVDFKVRTNNRQVLGFCEKMGYQIERVLSLAKELEEERPVRSRYTVAPSFLGSPRQMNRTGFTLQYAQ